MSFKDLNLSADVLRGVVSAGYTDPTPIQLRAIPVVLSGRDLIASAQTGTGKTAAFGLPVLTKLGNHRSDKPRCLVLEPTRELAAQVETAFRDFCRFNDLTIGLLYGGVGYGKQREELKSGVDVIVATPGRLLDHLEQGTVDLSGIEILVLDEVDRMLDMGFLPQVRRVVERCPKERQTLFFSATIPPEIESLTKWVVRDPEIIEIGARRMPAETITHALYPVARDQKYDLLLALLAVADAAVKEADGQVIETAEIAERRFHLRRQFAGWFQDEAAGFVTSVVAKLRQQWKAERGGLPCAGLRGGDQVASRKNNRKSAKLDRRRVDVPHRLHPMNNSVG